ncbi:MAG: RDD family protein [Candidatus Hodarchaeales archaeon]
MSMTRIEYKDATLPVRLIALVIDLIIGVGIAFMMEFGWLLEYDIFWKPVFSLEGEPQSLVILMFVIFFPIYHILFSSLTNGQSAGKLILGIRVVTDTNESTKRKFVLHAKRFFFLRGGTKVVKEIDPSVKGLS